MIKANAVGTFYRFSDLLYSGRFYNILAMFLLGFYAGRKQLFQNIEAYQPLLRKLVLWGAVIGIPANIALAWLMDLGSDYPPSLRGLYASVVYAIGVVPLSLCFAALMALAWQRSSWQGWLLLFAPVGRMALTNYLSQSIFCVLLFNGVGLDLKGQVGPMPGLGIVALILLFQIGFSHWWLRRFKFGPVEWLWRSMTYGKLQPILPRSESTELLTS
jgi:uncharacterized protein